MIRPKLYIPSPSITPNLSKYQIGVTEYLHLSNAKLQCSLKTKNTGFILNYVVRGGMSI